MTDERRPCVVKDRLKFFMGRTIAIRVAWDPKNDIVGELVDAMPLGRQSYLQLRVAGHLRFVALDQVLELSEPIS